MKADALADLLHQTVRLYHRLRATAEQIHGQGEASAGRRGVLVGLARDGEQTVPEMARARPVSRQYIQVLVNGLAADGFVEVVENPRHRRSSLVRITESGRSMLEQMDARERELLRRLRPAVTQAEIEAAAAVLATVRETLEKEGRHE